MAVNLYFAHDYLEENGITYADVNAHLPENEQRGEAWIKGIFDSLDASRVLDTHTRDILAAGINGAIAAKAK